MSNAQHTDERNANARLIAAAPDLLEALEGIFPTWNSPFTPGAYDLTREKADKARLAIIKAIGN